VSSSLSGVPIERRRRAAATLGLFSMLFLAVGAVAATEATNGLITAFVVIAVLVAVVLALIGWGVMRSIRLEQHERDLDAAIEAAVAAQGSTLRDLTCGCGHDHDPDVLHVPDDPCAHDGGGHECSRTCDTCVLSRLTRTAGNEQLGDRPRPTPAPARRPLPNRR